MNESEVTVMMDPLFLDNNLVITYGVRVIATWYRNKIRVCCAILCRRNLFVGFNYRKTIENAQI
jgi:hypothetical protein